MLIKSVLAASVALIAMPVAAATIITPVSATVDVGGPGFGSIDDTINQNGLLTGYTPGVTDFDTYLASNPIHTLVFAGNEWFSTDTTATITYDFGSVVGLDRLALWNEDVAGIGSLSLFGSTDGVSFSSIGVFSPTNNADNVNYGADVFSFAATSSRFVRFQLDGCPQPPGSFNACAIGEVAFRSADVAGAIPEPATWALMLLGFFGIGGMMRRGKATQIVSVAYS